MLHMLVDLLRDADQGAVVRLQGYLLRLLAVNQVASGELADISILVMQVATELVKPLIVTDSPQNLVTSLPGKWFLRQTPSTSRQSSCRDLHYHTAGLPCSRTIS
jgi:hypothetical protein